MKRHVEREEDNNVSSCQRGSRTFTATHCSQYFLSTVRTVVVSVAVVVLTMHSLAVLR